MRIFRAVILLSLMASFAVVAGISALLPFSKKRKRTHAIWLVHIYSKLILMSVNVKVEMVGLKKINKKKGVLIVSNHLSYLDIFIIAAQFPTLFITSVELQNSPLQGFFSNLGGSLFVERRSRWGLKKELAVLAEPLNQHFPVLFFPEGTSTDGKELRPFKRALFELSNQTGSELQPMAISYMSIGGRPIEDKDRENIFFFGDHEFIPHLWNFLSTPSLDIKLNVLPTIHPHEVPDRKEMAQLAFLSIKEMVLH